MTPRRKRYKNGTKRQTEQTRGTHARPDITEAAGAELRGKHIDTEQRGTGGNNEEESEQVGTHKGSAGQPTHTGSHKTT